MVWRTGSAAELAQELAKLLMDRELGRRLGNLARQRVLHEYSRNSMIEGHARIYERIIAD